MRLVPLLIIVAALLSYIVIAIALRRHKASRAIKRRLRPCLNSPAGRQELTDRCFQRVAVELIGSGVKPAILFVGFVVDDIITVQTKHHHELGELLGTGDGTSNVIAKALRDYIDGKIAEAMKAGA